MGVSIMTTAQRLASLTQLADTGGPLDGMKVGLFQNNFIPAADTVLADLTEADYDGYAKQVVGAFGSPYISVDGVPTITAPSLQFQPTGDTVANVIYGKFYTDTAGTVLIAAERFDTPVPLADETHALVTIPSYGYGQ